MASVPVLTEGPTPELDSLRRMIATSLYKTEAWRARLAAVTQELGLSVERTLRETDPSDLAEGLYLKSEAEGRVLGRYKFIRRSFLSAVLEGDGHWLSRPIVPNQLAPEVDLFSAR